MRRTTRATLRVESLEGRQLLSGAGATAHAAQVVSIARATPARPVTLRGTYRVDLAGGRILVQGNGQVPGLGRVRFSSVSAATNTAPEFLDVLLSGPRGSTARLRLEPTTAAGNGLTVPVRYTIADANGAFQGRASQGTGVLTLSPNLRQLGMSGRMSLSLRPQAA